LGLNAALEDLYRQLIIDHSRNPRNFRVLEGADRVAEGSNPLCGDEVKIYLKMDGERIAEISFQGSGCAISIASASLMTDSVKGKTRLETEALFDAFRALVTGKQAPARVALGKLAALGGVAAYPVRVKCATLAWHALRAALAGTGRVSTE